MENILFDFQKKPYLEKLQCVECKESLNLEAERYLICKNNHKFTFKNAIPIILSNTSRNSLTQILKSSYGETMENEYESTRKYTIRTLVKKITETPDIPIRMVSPRKFYDILTHNNDRKKIILSIGGGPTRQGETIINLNIDTYPNVDIVGDAHNLPFKDNSIDGIAICAVLEHIEDPKTAVNEIYRVLKKGGYVYAETPFLQHYHGYPFHYQNYTITGHNYLFKKFKILESGSIGGPLTTLVTVIKNIPEDYISNKYIRKIILYILGLILLPLRFLDIFFRQNKNNYKLTNAVYLFAKKV